MPGRGITPTYIEAVLANPTYTTYTTPDPTDPTLTRSFGPIQSFGNRMLRVVHRPDGDDAAGGLKRNRVNLFHTYKKKSK
jgi:cyanate lyase